MTAFLPPNLLILFTPRPPLEFAPPPEKRKCKPYSGIASMMEHFEDPKTVDFTEYEPKETPKERKARIAKMREDRNKQLIAQRAESWDPAAENDKHTGNPYKTLFVARMSYKTTEETLREAFEVYGPIRKVILVKDKEGKPTGYAFIEYERERDMKTAYKQGDAKKIDGRRVLVDVERGRTVENWRPRFLGGGKGGTRLGGPDVNQKWSGRSPPRSVSQYRGAPSRYDRHRGDRRDRGYDRDRRDHRDRDRGGGRDRDRRDYRDRDRYRR